MLPWSLRAEKFCSVFLEIFFQTENIRCQLFPRFSGNYFCSCFMLPWSLWAENICSVFEVRNYPSIYDFGLEVSPWNAISETRPPLCNTSSEAGALDTGGNVRIENESDRKFFKVFLKTTFFHESCYPDHYEPKIFFWIGKKWKFWLRNQRPKPPPPPPVINRKHLETPPPPPSADYVICERPHILKLHLREPKVKLYTIIHTMFINHK